MIFVFLCVLFNFSVSAQTTTPTKSVTVTPTETIVPTATQCQTKPKGDANCDGSIDLLDFEEFRQEFIAVQEGKFDITRAHCDFNGDKNIDLLDFEAFRKGYIEQKLQTPTPTLKPSPSPTISPSLTKTPTPTTRPTVTATVTPTSSTGALPAQVLNLTNWKETLPIGQTEKPTEIFQPALATYKLDPWFVVSGDGGVRFRAPVNGVTTSGSGYPRSELREMTNNGATNASWSSSTGVHTMTVEEAITAVPQGKKHVVAGQIHDANDDVIVIRLELPKLFIDINGTDGPVLDANYTLGKKFTVKFEVTNDTTRIYYNNSTTPSHTMSKKYSGAYFKAGAYTQSNCDTEAQKGITNGCNNNNYGEVVIYNLKVTH